MSRDGVRARVALIALLVFSAPLSAQTVAPPTITIVSGSTAAGRSTDLWLAILRRRLSPSEYDSVAPLVRPLLPEQKAWSDLIESRAATWPALIAPLVSLFPGVRPRPLTIVLGNRGSEDAFTHDSLTIGFDLAALVRVYGAASIPDNADKLDRFIRHETIHTLQKRWLVQHPFDIKTPLDKALFDIWSEGLGNYYSLSAAWYPAADGTPSELTRRTLAVLEPRFVERIAGLACADAVSAKPLLKGLSSGPFDQKWGAVPAAIWLRAEQTTDSIALRSFVLGGPRGVWELGRRHLPTEIADAFMRAKARAADCSNAGRDTSH